MFGLRLASGWSREARRSRLMTLGRWVPALAPQLRRTALRNAARVAPDRDEAAQEELATAHFSNLSIGLAEAIERWSGQDTAEERVGYPLFDDARRILDGAHGKGRGVLLPSAHLANWEQVARGIISAGYPFVTLVRRAYDPRLDDAVLRPLRAGISTIARGEPGAATAVVRALRRGAILGAPMDLASRVPSVDVPFFGVPTPFPVGPATLALRTGAPIVVATWEARETVEGFVEGIGAEEVPTEGDARAITASIAAALERRIAAAPERWVLVHSRW